MLRAAVPYSRRVLAGATAFAVIASQLVFPPQADAASLGSATASAGSAPPPSVSAVQSFQPDLFTGRATTSLPIAVPPGRKGLQPSLALAYASSGRNGWLGVGWSLDAGYIERSTKNGVPKYDSSDTFAFMFQGVSSDLVRIPDGTYRAKDEGLFLRVESKGASGWEVRDKSGTRYLFGQTAASQIQSAGKVFRWALDKVIDLRGNTLLLSYAADQGQLYLSQIRYTGHEPTGLAPSNQVDFTLESRPDAELSYRSGFSVMTAKRLKTIDVKATVGGSLSLARRYQLAYTLSARTGRSLLTSLTQFGTDGATSLPPITLTYSQDPPSYMRCQNCVPTLSSGGHDWQMQVHAGNLFPRDDGGNDQRLWPSGSWEPGVKTWSEKVCQRRLFWKECHDEPRSAAIPSVGWSAPQLIRTGSLNGISWSIDANGNLTASGPQDSHLLAITWVYSAVSKTVSLSGMSAGGRADVFYVSPGGSAWSPASGTQVPLSPGWTTIALTAYNETGGFSLSVPSNLAGQVDAMNRSQFTPMSLSADFNGDGLTDLAHVEPVANRWDVAINSVNGFSQRRAWLSATLSADTVPLAGDADRDGRADVILWNAATGLWQVARSTGTGLAPPATWHSGFGAGQTPFMGDFNGDQFLDVGTFSGGTWTVALSTGGSFGSVTTWLSGFGSGAAPLTGDFNGDGVTDAASASGGAVSVALSDGAHLAPQAGAWITGFGSGQAVTSADINGDGLTDVLYYDKAAGTIVVAHSTGRGFSAPVTLLSDRPFGLRSADDTLQVGDFRGNGLSGFGVFNAVSGAAQIAYALGAQPDLLASLLNGIGGATSLTYAPSTDFANAFLPFSLPVVTQVGISDGLGHAYATSYRYAGGLYDEATGEFRGFQTATVADAAGTTTATTFSQTLHTKGRPLGVEVRDSAGRLYAKTANTWSCTEPYPGVHFTRLDQTDSVVYDGDDTFRQTRSRLSYDQYGNVVRADDDGEVAVSGDERAATTTFTYDIAAWVLATPSLTQTLDAAGAVVAKRRFFYDAAGQLTKEEEWLNLPAEQWLATNLTYDAYGNVATVTDALGRTTANTFDTGSYTYLLRIQNVLGHTRQLAYDPRFGQVTSSTDQNNQTTTTEYDALGRVTKVIGPTDTAALPTISYAYDFSTVPTKATVSTRVQSGAAEVLTVTAFTDGLGRTIQTRSPAENPAKQVVTGTVEFDSRGLVSKQWVSYLSAVSSTYVPLSVEPGASSLASVSYAYDPVGRATDTTEPDGSKTLVNYNDGETTTTLANGTQTQRTVDAYGRLIRVEEVLSDTQSLTTTYAYDALSNLVRVTDAQGHLTQIAYDSLGRKLGMDDPDMGHWAYGYDVVDNLTSQTDARGVVISFAYDTLNRLTQKRYIVPAGAGIADPGTVTYSYDDLQQSFAKGKLTSISDGSGSSRFVYDRLGRLLTETKVLDGTTYTIQRAYDLLGRLTTLTYPDGDLAAYTYNAQGGIETVGLQHGATTQPIISDITYNAAGQLTKIVYGNGTVSDYTYNPQTLRLDQLRTTGPAGTLQDFGYAFDAVGNVSAITDRVHTGTQSFQYDALNRLTRATGAYGVLSYAYDPLGNLTSKEGMGLTYGLQGGAKPHAVTTTSAGWTLQYDANGNLTTKSTTADPAAPDWTPQSFTYNADNRLIEVKSAPEDTATLTLKPGWNVFSLPVLPDDARITSIFPNFSADFEQVAWFDAAASTPDTQRFKHFVGDPVFNDFDSLQYGQGYQVYCKNPNGVTLTLRGKLPTQQVSTTLLPGWHLLPASTLETHPIAWLTQGLSADQVLRFDATTQAFSAVTDVAPGQAYFLHVTAPSQFAPALPRDPATRFVYDGDGGRVKQITAAGTTRFLGESVEVAPDGTQTKYVFAGSERIAALETPTGVASLPAPNSTRLARAWEQLRDTVTEFLGIPSAEAAIAPVNLHFYLSDHLGSTNLVTDGTGAVVELAEHTPYGSLSRREGTANVPQKFTGQRLDMSTGLYFYHARYYDPTLGRFTQPDPFIQDPSDPQMLNRYAYVRNNPVNFVDPSGYGWIRWVTRIVGAIVGAVVGFAVGGPEGAVTGAIWGYAIGDSIGAAIEGRSEQQSVPVVLPTSSPRGLPGQLLHAKTGNPISVAEAEYLARYAGNNRLSLYLNGINTTARDASIQGRRNADALVVFYNPTDGLIADMDESRVELNPPLTPLDRQLKALLDKISADGIPVDITAYSEGTVVATKVLGVDTHLVATSTFRLAGSVVSKKRAGRAAGKAGAQMIYIPVKWNDPVGALPEPNNKFRVFGSIIGLTDCGIRGYSGCPHDIDGYLPPKDAE